MRGTWLVIGVVGAHALCGTWSLRADEAPYPPSPVIAAITWHWDTRVTAAPGSDLWPVTWAADDNLYVAWGDGGGFGGTNSDGRVAMGFARIEGPPESYVGINVNGGKDPLHPASFPDKGKTGSLLAVGNTLYAWQNMQDGKWPDVNHALIWSDDLGASWQRADWVFPKGAGNIKPARFINFGRGYTGVPEHLAGFVYFYGTRQPAPDERTTDVYLGRVPQDRVTDRAAYEFFAGLDADGHPVWSPQIEEARPVFSDPQGAGSLTVVYHPVLKRYLGTCFHGGPGQLGVFDAPEPWGQWTTVAYYDSWGGMGAEGDGLTCSFPQKWMSPDGLTIWCIFSVWGKGAKDGINAHDCFNLVKTTLTLR